VASFSESRSLLGLVECEDEDAKILRSVDKYLPSELRILIAKTLIQDSRSP
jgi:hypothetical protein